MSGRPAPVGGPRERLLVDVAARVLALPDDRPRLVAVDGMSGAGKTTLAGELADVVAAAGRFVLRLSYDGFHHPRERRHRRGRESAEGYLEDAFDAAALRSSVLEPLRRGAASVPLAVHDVAAERALREAATADVPQGGVVVVDGSFLTATELAPLWDLVVLCVADPSAVLDRAVARDLTVMEAERGEPPGRDVEEQLRERYVRRYLAAWVLHEERADPWRRADVVVDLTDPSSPRVLA